MVTPLIYTVLLALELNWQSLKTAPELFEDLNKIVHPGQETYIALNKIVQTGLSHPYSNCSESEDYRQANRKRQGYGFLRQGHGFFVCL